MKLEKILSKNEIEDIASLINVPVTPSFIEALQEYIESEMEFGKNISYIIADLYYDLESREILKESIGG